MISDEAIQALPCRGELRASIILLHGYSSQASVHSEDGSGADAEVANPRYS
jgi:hypothetical protein